MSKPGFPKPFIGLRPFDRCETGLFFGREEQIDGLLTRLEDHRFLAVVGASGCGKSSLVRAGLLPALDRGLLTGAEEGCRILELRPGHDPIRSLAEALFRESSDLGDQRSSTSDLEATLRTGPLGCLRAMQLLGLGKDGRPVLLLVDQFEELFRFRRSDDVTPLVASPAASVAASIGSSLFPQLIRALYKPFGFQDVAGELLAATVENRLAGKKVIDPAQVSRERDTAAMFVRVLLASTDEERVPIVRSAEDSEETSPPSPETGMPRVYVIITMRSDFIGHCDAFRGLPEAISANQFLVPRLTRHQMEEAIVGPLERFGIRPAPDLVNRVLNTAGTDPDQLPLLQHALLRAWDHAVRNRAELSELRLDDYVGAGGMEEALARDAEEALRKVGSPQWRVVEILFRCLSKQDPGGPVVRRVSTVGEVAAIAGCSVKQVLAVIPPFRVNDRNFIIHRPQKGAPALGTLDICHEALLRQWPRVDAWIAEESRAADFFRFLAGKAKQWLDHPSYGDLLKNPDLQRAIRWRSEFGHSPQWTDRHRPNARRGVLFFISVSAVWHRIFWLISYSVAFAIVGGIGILAWVSIDQARKANAHARTVGGTLRTNELPRLE